MLRFVTACNRRAGGSSGLLVVVLLTAASPRKRLCLWDLPCQLLTSVLC